MKVLIIGNSGLISPSIVKALQTRDPYITVFNREEIDDLSRVRWTRCGLKLQTAHRDDSPLPYNPPGSATPATVTIWEIPGDSLLSKIARLASLWGRWELLAICDERLMLSVTLTEPDGFCFNSTPLKYDY